MTEGPHRQRERSDEHDQLLDEFRRFDAEHRGAPPAPRDDDRDT